MMTIKPSFKKNIVTISKSEAKSFKIFLAITKDDDADPNEQCVFSAVVLNLPGAGGCGGTREEAIADAKQSVKELIASYEEEGTEIPWKEVTGVTPEPGEEFKAMYVYV